MIRRSWVRALACADIYVPAILRSRTSWQLKAMPGIVKNVMQGFLLTATEKCTLVVDWT